MQHTKPWKKYLIYLLLVALSLVFLFPLFWMLTTALQAPGEAASGAVFPKSSQWSNFVDAWKAANFSLMFVNSLIVSTAVTLGQIVTSALAGYAFARINFLGKKTLFALFLSTMIIPFQMIVIPIFIILQHLGWIDTYMALIVPNLANAFGIFLFRQFFLTIPHEIEEAAMIDGASRWQVLWRIMFPLARPAAVTLFLFTFIAEWNDLFKPLVFTQSEDLRTVQFGLTVFQEQFNTNYTLLMAASTIVTVPVLILFLIGQKQFIRGIATTGMK